MRSAFYANYIGSTFVILFITVAHSNEEDWAAKARAWADAKTAMENQHQQSQFTPVGRPEEQIHYPEQYPHSVESHYAEFQHQSIPASNYQQVPVSAAPLPRPQVVHPSEAPSVSSDSSYIPGGHFHTVRDGTPAADSNAMFQCQGNLPKSPSVHQQEVPSSYSSVTGNNSYDILYTYVKHLLQKCYHGTQMDY